MKNIRDQAIVLDMEYAVTSPQPISSRTPQFRNIHFSNITAETKAAAFINGLDEMPVEDITFNDIQFEAERGLLIKNVRNIEFHNIRINTKIGASLIAEDVNDIIIDGVRTLKPLTGTAVVNLNNVQNAFIYNNSPVPGSDLFFEPKRIKDERNHFKRE